MQCPQWWRRIGTSEWVTATFIAVLTVIAYLPALRAAFIWDDDSHLTQNQCIIGPLGFKDIWSSSHAVYYPLVLSTFWGLHKFVGLNPMPYHLLNVLVHVASAVLLWRLLQQLHVRGAWLGAALWALHPVMVQSVAWITELKNTQSCFFYLLSILFFLNADGADTNPKERRWRFGLSLLFFVLAITSKPATVMLPVVLGLCLWWRRERLRWRDLGVLAPFFLISAAASGWTIWEQKFHSHALGLEWAETWPQRLAIAGCDIWFYLGKLFWPHPLIFIYPRWNIDTAKWITFLPTLAALGALILLWFRRNGRLRPVFFASGYFVISLFPVLGFFNVYFFRYSFVSDHFQYLASMGLIALAAATLSQLPRVVRFGLLAVLAFLTWRQAHIYHDLETLWRDTLVKNPRCWMACNNLGVVLRQKGDVDEAIRYYEKTLQIHPNHLEARKNLGAALLQEGRVDEAVAYSQEAVEAAPGDADVHNNLGNALLHKGKWQEAIDHFLKALEIRPDYTEAHNNFGNVLLQKGRIDEAIAHYQQALEIEPDYADAYSNLGRAFLMKGQLNEAIAHFLKALEIEPNYAEVHYNLGTAFLQKGDLDEAISHCQKALEIKSDYVQAHYNLGNALLQKGQVDDAIAHYQRAVEIKPDYAEAYSNLGSALLMKGRQNEAIVHFLKALEIEPNYAEVHHNLGTAFLQKGDLDEAISHCQKALEIKPDYVQAHYNLGNALLQKGQVDDAIAHYQRAVEIKPDYAEAQGALGDAFFRKRNFGEAIACYEAVLRVRRDSAGAHNNLGCILVAAGRTNEAVPHYIEAVRLNPNYRDAHYNLALALARLGRREEAVAHFTEALRLDPGNAEAKQRLRELGVPAPD